jgi:DNA replication protein DnaC
MNSEQQEGTTGQETTEKQLKVDQELFERRQAEFAKLHNKEAIDRHWDKVRSHETSLDKILSRAISQTEQRQYLDYETARGYVIKIIEDLFGSKKFITDDKTKWLLTNLTKYFIYDKTCKIDLHRGILLYGGTGTGKTTLFRIFRRLAGALDMMEGYNKAYSIEKTSDIVSDVRYRANEDIIRKFYSNNICFDDLGQEASDAKVYGNTVSVMGEILFNRYDRFQTNKQLTHLTTNLSEDELKDKYGERIHSRMQEMFNWILVDGEDLRNI